MNNNEGLRVESIPEMLGEVSGQRSSVMDLRCVSENALSEMSKYNARLGQVIFDHTMVGKISGMFAPRTISVIFANAGNFRKDIEDSVDDIDRWLFLLKHSTRMREYSDSFQSEVFRRFLEVLEIGSFTQEEFICIILRKSRRGYIMPRGKKTVLLRERLRDEKKGRLQPIGRQRARCCLKV